ncbi:hypothetical protein FACS189421_05220 [Bacteroidia bacterium]|nr:hypothetical protein FACS189421_05220 [Bacteroidia bacterium]GHT46765.1 hypothetical protein FACS189440_05530 [Bacteroidia bacterium]
MLNNLTRENWDRMQALGLTLTPGQLYNESTPSLYKAVVQFDGGCTGITVSDKGLIFTNHHCGYGAIQSKSSVEHDYLKNGFVAHTPEDEIPIEGMYVLYLKKTIPVTQSVLDGESTDAIQKQYTDLLGEGYVVTVDEYYAGNEYYVNIYKKYTDIRLVFAPPSSIGKFGGDTDNWMWPRHTGDFSVFRVYAGAGNEPAEYADTNVPYKPEYYAPVSLNGYDEGSFAMVLGFPGSTDRYLSSWGVERRVKSSNEPRIEVRGVKQDIWKEAMLQSDAIRIKYASKYARSSNYWKNSIGMNRGLARMHVVERKQALENQFTQWIAQNPAQRKVYENTLNLQKEGYIHSMDNAKTRTYLVEAFYYGAEIFEWAYYANYIHSEGDNVNPALLFNEMLLPLYKDYEPALDEKVLAAMLQILKEKIPAAQLPAIFPEIDKKYKGNYAKYAAEVFKKTILTSPDKLKAALEDKKQFKKLEKDPAWQLSQSIGKTLESVSASLKEDNDNIKEGRHLFMAGLREMMPEKNFPSDANFTMRLTYGKVGGYHPYDAAWYDYCTTTKGIFEKYDVNNPEFNVQPEVMDLLRKKDFGRYGNKDSDMNIDFLADLDITGGNSGSPVFDGKGRLTGLAFDGNWEAMSGDIAFETDVQKCIAVDVRYILYMIDKWGNCQRLLNELTIE